MGSIAEAKPPQRTGAVPQSLPQQFESSPPQTTCKTTQVQTNSSVKVLDSFDPLFPLSGPSQASQTTVITTTTQTTTTQFSPLMYRIPREVHHRPIRQCPLADKPIPSDFQALFDPFTYPNMAKNNVALEVGNTALSYNVYDFNYRLTRADYFIL
jgi:hypothetical protein